METKKNREIPKTQKKKELKKKVADSLTEKELYDKWLKAYTQSVVSHFKNIESSRREYVTKNNISGGLKRNVFDQCLELKLNDPVVFMSKLKDIQDKKSNLPLRVRHYILIVNNNAITDADKTLKL